MMMEILALLIGIIAGLRALAVPTVVSFAAAVGGLSLYGTPLAFMGYTFTPRILLLCAIGELVNDKLPKAPSRLIRVQLVTRLVTGAWAGAALTTAQGRVLLGLLIGSVGAALGSWSGHRARRGMAAAFGRDFPAALLDDAVAIAGAVLIVLVAA